MFERYTDRARQVVVLAVEEARVLKHDYIGTEHILLGLLREEEGLAARVLESLGVTVEGTRAGVVGRVESGEEVTSGQIPFTPRAKKVLDLAQREALALAHNYIGTEHILLGLVHENEGGAARILLDFDADSEEIRTEIIRMVGPGGREHSVGEGAAAFGRRESPLERIGLSDALLDGAAPALRSLADEIEDRLDRSADAGDLLVLLASIPDGLAARALVDAGVDLERLASAVDQARRDGVRSRLLPAVALLTECDEVRVEKEAAVEKQEFAQAAELRDRERELIKQALASVEGGQDELLAEVRSRLGIGEV